MALLQSFGGQLEKMSLQKLLFLMTNKQTQAAYSFIPFHYGSYSISANADLTAMVRNGLIAEGNKHFYKKDKINYIDKLTSNDKSILAEITDKYGNLDCSALIKFTYLNFCYYAINSKLAKDVLSKTEYEKVLAAKPVSDKTILLTIGYEGISLEEYLNRLIKNDVRILVDVRCNAVSMKFGFSKKTLMFYCEKLNIEYVHIPEVGIRSEYRQNLKMQKDYFELFERYKEITLEETKDFQHRILAMLKNNQRIALTCFESDFHQCHRSHLANSLVRLSDWKFELNHI